MALGACSGGSPRSAPDASSPDASPPPIGSGVKSDILFVLDDSGGMADEQAALRAAIPAFIDALGETDYQIGVVSTNMDQQNFPMGEVAGDTGATFDMNGCLSTLDSSGCHAVGIDHGCLRGPIPARRIVRSSTSAKSTLVGNASVGTCGSGIETGLLAMISALQESAPKACNAGFLREAATLVVIILSDENDTDSTPIDQYVRDLVAMKDPRRLRVAAIVAAENGAATKCNIVNGAQCGVQSCATPAQCRPPGFNFPCDSCDFNDVSDCCTALATNHPTIGAPGRYVDFAHQVEDAVLAVVPSLPRTMCIAPAEGPAACLVESICQADYSATLTRIASMLVLH
jgi:hypothetical protein